MSQIIVRSVPGSPYGRSVLATLLEKDAPFQLIFWPIEQFQSPEHYEIHPFGRVPWIEHDGFQLFESQAILRYIDRVMPGAPLMPEDVKRLGRADTVLNVSDAYLYALVTTTLGFQRLTKPMRFGTEPDEAVIAAALPQCRRVFGALASILGDAPYIAGDRFTLADIAIAAQLDFLFMTPEFADLIGPHATLKAWLDRTLARPSFQASTYEKSLEIAASA